MGYNVAEGHSISSSLPVFFLGMLIDLSGSPLSTFFFYTSKAILLRDFQQIIYTSIPHNNFIRINFSWIKNEIFTNRINENCYIDGLPLVNSHLYLSAELLNLVASTSSQAKVLLHFNHSPLFILPLKKLFGRK